MAPTVKQERTDFRDEVLPLIHSQYGADHSHSLSFLGLEYDRGIPVALLEYRPEDAPPLKEMHPVLQSTRALADASGIPFFVARHTADLREWTLHAMNDQARGQLGGVGEKTRDEAALVRLLYRMRSREVPAEIVAKVAEPAAAGVTFSGRHREYGWDVPVNDLDLVTFSSDSGKPAAVVEYKKGLHIWVDPRSRPIQAMRRLADASGLPFFVVRYTDDYATFELDPVGEAACKALGVGSRIALPQAQYFAFMRCLHSGVDGVALSALDRTV